MRPPGPAHEISRACAVAVDVLRFGSLADARRIAGVRSGAGAWAGCSRSTAKSGAANSIRADSKRSCVALVCQNESIADSNVELASDLRRQVREMLVDGKSDDAIFHFMTDRYGEFVRFAPPLSPKTALIWGAPFAMLLLGGIIVFRVARQRSRMPLDE